MEVKTHKNFSINKYKCVLSGTLNKKKYNCTHVRDVRVAGEERIVFENTIIICNGGKVQYDAILFGTRNILH